MAVAYPFERTVARLRRLESQRYAMSGAPCVTYYPLQAGTNVDPLYGEPLNPSALHPADAPFDFASGLQFRAVLEYGQYDDEDPAAGQVGSEVTRTAFLTFADVDWICAGMSPDAEPSDAVPKFGDVVVADGQWWDVTKAGRLGRILNTDSYTGWKLDLKWYSKFGAERKL